MDQSKLEQIPPVAPPGEIAAGLDGVEDLRASWKHVYEKSMRALAKGDSRGLVSQRKLACWDWLKSIDHAITRAFDPAQPTGEQVLLLDRVFPIAPTFRTSYTELDPDWDTSTDATAIAALLERLDAFRVMTRTVLTKIWDTLAHAVEKLTPEQLDDWDRIADQLEEQLEEARRADFVGGTVLTYFREWRIGAREDLEKPLSRFLSDAEWHDFNALVDESVQRHPNSELIYTETVLPLLKTLFLYARSPWLASHQT